MFKCASTVPVLLSAFVLAAPRAAAHVNDGYDQVPLHFEANRGQTHSDVRFLVRGAGYSIYLTAAEAVLVLGDGRGHATRTAHGEPALRASQAVVLRMALVGGRSKPVVTGLEELPGRANYFIGRDPTNWRTGVPTYAKVHYREVYPGIDLLYYGRQRELEYDFVVAPGANPDNIVLDFQGTERLEINAQGELVLYAAGGDLRQHKPVIYQEIEGTRREVAGGYVLKGPHRVGFEVAPYDRSRPLVIDPVVLSYSTYLGGSGSDWAYAVAVDGAGNTYVAGYTTSMNFPTTGGVFQSARAGVGPLIPDAFVTKLNATGSALIYSTYLGGNDSDQGQAIAVDASGAAYVAGFTLSDNFPTTPGALQGVTGGSADVFVAKLDSTGAALAYSTRLGGSGYDEGLAITVDDAGSAHVTGYTDSLDFPVTPGAPQRIAAGSYDAFVTKLNLAGSAAVYSTYLGGTREDYGRGIAVDAEGNAYTAGSTNSVDFPITAGAFQSTWAGGWDDPFVTKLTPAGALVYSTYMGGSNNDRASAIAVDGGGNAYVAGTTLSLDFPVTPGAFQSAYGGGLYDAYVAKVNPAGSALVYATYLGGLALDYGQGIAVDRDGSAYVTGTTDSTDFPITVGAAQPSLGGRSDAFVTRVNPTGSGLTYSTYLGGSGDDWGSGIALDHLPSANAHVAGYTTSPDFPIANSYQSSHAGGPIQYGSGPYDTFVTKVAPPETLIPIPGTFEAENFDLGGEGIAYHDNVPGNGGGRYRPNEDVDIAASADGSYVVNNFETGEWLNYTISVSASALYDVEIRASSAMPDSAFHIEVDGSDVTGRVVVPNTGSWDSFQWIGKTGVSLAAGQHVLKIVADQQYYNVNSIRVRTSAATADAGPGGR